MFSPYRRILLFCLAGAVLLVTAIAAESGKQNTCRVLVTGFGPFAGRPLNGSWIAASSLQGKAGRAAIKALKIPVAWGAPAKLLGPVVTKGRPEILICLGEGFPGFFTIEAVARNRRRALKDVNNNLPPKPFNETNGPAEIMASAPVIKIAKILTEKGFPTHVSTDAGGYLCDEMFYTIERLKAGHDHIKLVLFVHMPPQGQVVFLKGKAVRCDQALVSKFARVLLNTALAVNFGKEEE